jgi:hypothetical protein
VPVTGVERLRKASVRLSCLCMAAGKVRVSMRSAQLLPAADNESRSRVHNTLSARLRLSFGSEEGPGVGRYPSVHQLLISLKLIISLYLFIWVSLYRVILYIILHAVILTNAFLAAL